MSRRERGPQDVDMIYGTLPDWVIASLIKNGTIKIDPLPDDWESQMGPVSLDFHLGEKILVPKTRHQFIDLKKGVTEEDYDIYNLSDGDPFVFNPGQFIITETREHLEIPDDIIARLEGRSSLARIGVVVHLTAGRFDPGWVGKPVLELKNNESKQIILVGGMDICAFTFERLMAPVDRPFGNGDRYSDGTIHSKVHTNHR